MGQELRGRSFHSEKCGNLANEDLRELAMEERMEPETSCKGNDTTEMEKPTMAMKFSQKGWKLGFSVLNIGAGVFL
jgi:hypothetical protein